MTLPIKAFSLSEINKEVASSKNYKAPGLITGAGLITGEILKQLSKKAIIVFYCSTLHYLLQFGLFGV